SPDRGNRSLDGRGWHGRGPRDDGELLGPYAGRAAQPPALEDPDRARFPRSTITSCSTTPGAATPRSGCAPRPRSNPHRPPVTTALLPERTSLRPRQRCWLTRALPLVSPLSGQNQS